uniref:NmrA-like domain-containing protein n=1 Tax=Mycena chlorophos TaxID=658473 RepID=A0ABQ0LXP3_MYCCL|nr:predicted protein [Mycena chlorophos]
MQRGGPGAAGFKTFAVFGAGLVGAPIVRALHARGATVIAVIRPGTAHQALPLPAQVPVFERACTEAYEIGQLLRENSVEVVISTLSAANVDSQNCLAETAREAGARLFVPSEFGIVSEGVTDFVAVIEHLKSCDIPYARFYVGFFMETIPAMMGLSVNRKINVVGCGNMPCSFTASEDVAGFVAHVLTTLPPSELHNKTFRLQGDRSTLSDLAILFDTELNFVKMVPGPMGEVWTRMQLAAESGMASTGWDLGKCDEGKDCAGCTNKLWPGHEWKTIVKFFKLKGSRYAVAGD